MVILYDTSPFLPQSLERANRYQSDREKNPNETIANRYQSDREKNPNGTIANRYPTSTRLAAVARETPT